MSTNTILLKQTVPTSLDAFKMWILITKGFHKLTSKEADLFALILQKRQEYSSKITDSELLNEFVVGVKARKDYKDMLGYDKDSAINNLFSRLKLKGVLKDDGINPAYIPKLSKDFDSFEVKFLVKVNK